MTTALTATGLTTDTQAETLAALETDERSGIDNALDLSAASPLGQLNRIYARALTQLNEALAAVYLSMDPDSATGDALDRLCAITGTYRRAATKSQVSVTVTIAGLTTFVAGDLIAHVTGRPTDRFISIEGVSNADPSPANFAVVFEAETAGPVAAPADELTISVPASGWDAIVSHPDATLGLAVETHAELRARRASETAAPGSASVDGIAADISALASAGTTAVESVTVYENVSDATVDSIPPHAFEAIVYGPASPSTADNDAIAEAIFTSKAAGINTYGNTSRTVTDASGISHTINFTRPTAVPVTVTTLAVDTDTDYAGDTALRDTVEARALEDLAPGRDLHPSMVAAWALEVAGVLRVTSVALDSGTAWTGAVSITTRQIATVDSGDVTVSSTPATP